MRRLIHFIVTVFVMVFVWPIYTVTMIFWKDSRKDYFLSTKHLFNPKNWFGNVTDY